MSRGFLAGAGWGTVVAGFGLVVASQIADLAPNGVEQIPPAVAVANAPTAPVDVGPTNVGPTETEAAPDMPQDAAPDMAASQPEIAPQPQMPDSAVPSDSGSPDVIAAPAPVEADSPPVAPSAENETAVVPEAQVVIAAPDAPSEAGAAPEVPGASTATVEVARAAGDLPKAEGRDLAPIADAGAPPAPEIPQTSAADSAAPAGITPAESLPETVVEAPAAEGAAAEPVPDFTISDVAVPEGVAPEVTGPDQTVVSETAVSELPSVRPAPGFEGKVDGVKTGRLPSISTPPATESITATEPAVPETEAAAPDDTSLPPIERFARGFENTAGKPLFAILLQDTGGPDIDREALAAMPFPVSFVIDPMAPDAATAAQIYRAAGQEVLMLGTGIPAGANASDLAVSFEAMFAVLPESVAVVDLEQGGFQGNRTLASQILSLVEDEGRGMVSWDRGLNAASQVARRKGVRNAVIFRALDSADESSPVIRRYLDRAAFKAAQDGRVLVAGKTRPETVAALLEWAVEGRAATVAIAPSTAVMTTQ